MENSSVEKRDFEMASSFRRSRGEDERPAPMGWDVGGGGGGQRGGQQGGNSIALKKGPKKGPKVQFLRTYA